MPRRFQRVDRRGRELQAVARRRPDPARDREQSARREAREICLQRLHGIQVALVQRLHAGAGRGEGIEEADLHEVVTPLAARDEAACLRRVHGHARIVVDVAPRSRRRCRPTRPTHARVELDRIDAACIVGERHEDVAAAAGAEDEHLRPVEQPVRQRRGRVTEKCDGIPIAVVARDRAHALRVGEHRELLRRDMPRAEAQARRMPKRHGRALDHRQQAERTGRFDARIRLSTTSSAWLRPLYSDMCSAGPPRMASPATSSRHAT